MLIYRQNYWKNRTAGYLTV